MADSLQHVFCIDSITESWKSGRIFFSFKGGSNTFIFKFKTLFLAYQGKESYWVDWEGELTFESGDLENKIAQSTSVRAWGWHQDLEVDSLKGRCLMHSSIAITSEMAKFWRMLCGCLWGRDNGSSDLEVSVKCICCWAYHWWLQLLL